MKKIVKKILALLGFKKLYKAFLSIQYKNLFNPGLAGVFTNPFYFARKNLFSQMKTLSSNIIGNVLDIGCGTKPYQNLFPCKSYTGLEIDTPEMRKVSEIEYFYDGHTFPFKNETYDSIICNQTLEHVFNPDEFLEETNRVIKRGGKILLTIPFVWDEHSQPYDYARYSSFGLAHLMKNHSFKIIEQRKSVNTIAVIFQMINCYLYKKINTRFYFLNFFLVLILTSMVNIAGIIAEKILPKNDDLYLDNVILAQKI